MSPKSLTAGGEDAVGVLDRVGAGAARASVLTAMYASAPTDASRLGIQPSDATVT